MKTIQIKTEEIADNGVGYFNAIELEFNNSTIKSVSYDNFMLQFKKIDSNKPATPFYLKHDKNIEVYLVNSQTDTDLTGKSPIKEIVPAGLDTFIRVKILSEKRSVLNFVYPKDYNYTITYLSRNGSASTQVTSRIVNLTTIPNDYLTTRFFTFKTTPAADERVINKTSDFYNKDVVLNAYNSSGDVILSGSFTPAMRDLVNSTEEAGQRPYFQFRAQNLVLDLVNIPNRVVYCSIQDGGGNNFTCSSTDIPFITNPANMSVQYQIAINVKMDSQSIDNLLIACANKSVKNYINNNISLKGSRTTVSDAAVTNLNAAGITVAITPA